MGKHGEHRTLVNRTVGAACLAAFALVPTGAFACRLALLLAIDVSSSIDSREYSLQKNGLAAALIAPEVVSAFLSSGDPVALAAYEWSGQRNQRMILNWRLIESEAALLRAAEEVAAVRRISTGWPTALGYALGHGAVLMRDAPPCLSRTIDVSGDGRNNDGFPPHYAFKHFDLTDITVNGLVIGGAEDVGALETYYRERVIHGFGAFVETAEDHRDFERAMRRKLEREVRALSLGSTE